MATAILEKGSDEHTWRFTGHRVTQLLVDPGRFGLQSVTLDGTVEIRCGVPFTFRDVDGRELTIDPEQPEQLAPLLTLVERALVTVRVRHTSELIVEFGDGSALSVAPHDRYEAWEVRGSGALKALSYIAEIGGGSPWG